MKIGMLWFDNNPKIGVEDKVRRAAKYYQNKYGKAANLCFTANWSGNVDGIDVRMSTSMPEYNFWIGQKEQQP